MVGNANTTAVRRNDGIAARWVGISSTKWQDQLALLP
jgi:hypothetical protein